MHRWADTHAEQTLGVCCVGIQVEVCHSFTYAHTALGLGGFVWTEDHLVTTCLSKTALTIGQTPTYISPVNISDWPRSSSLPVT